MNKAAAAPVTPIRQRSQYTCMATSLTMCLKANGLDVDEDTVNKVMGAKPMQGASWEQAFAAAQHFGMRTTMIIPATLNQVKAWTDRGIPVMIAWNPEGRPWSHASVVFDVTDDGFVLVADPNIPDPDETVRKVTKDDFYHKWFEKWPDYLVRRPAVAVEREITADGKQRVASVKVGGQSLAKERVFKLPANTKLVRTTAEVYEDREDAEGYLWRLDPRSGQVDLLNNTRKPIFAVYNSGRGDPIAEKWTSEKIPQPTGFKMLAELRGDQASQVLHKLDKHMHLKGYVLRPMLSDMGSKYGPFSASELSEIDTFLQKEVVKGSVVKMSRELIARPKENLHEVTRRLDSEGPDEKDKQRFEQLFKSGKQGAEDGGRLPEFFEVWEAALTDEAKGLDFNDPEDRVSFRIGVASRTRNLKTEGILDLIRKWGGSVAGNSSRDAAAKAETPESLLGSEWKQGVKEGRKFWRRNGVILREMGRDFEVYAQHAGAGFKFPGTLPLSRAVTVATNAIQHLSPEFEPVSAIRTAAEAGTLRQPLSLRPDYGSRESEGPQAAVIAARWLSGRR